MKLRLLQLKQNELSVPALGCVIVIGLADLKLQFGTHSRLIEALVDETAHAATALLLFGALDPQGATRIGLAAALGGVLIDVDHVPMEFWRWDILTAGTGRPYPHSLTVLLAAGGLAHRLPAAYRGIGTAMVAGLATHLVRDLATGGVPVLWPITARAVRMPYAVYTLLLITALFRTVLWEHRPTPN